MTARIFAGGGALGTPSAARSSMMTVAGASDDDAEADLITDSETMEEGTVWSKMTVGELRMGIHRAFSRTK